MFLPTRTTATHLAWMFMSSTEKAPEINKIQVLSDKTSKTEIRNRFLH